MDLESEGIKKWGRGEKMSPMPCWECHSNTSTTLGDADVDRQQLL